CVSMEHDPSGNVYMSGYTVSSIGLATPGAFQTTLAGSNDAILVKWLDDTLVHVQQPFNDTMLCKGQTLQVAYDASYNFNPGNNFTVQLSNASGSFASPTNIGNVLATGP